MQPRVHGAALAVALLLPACGLVLDLTREERDAAGSDGASSGSVPESGPSDAALSEGGVPGLDAAPADARQDATSDAATDAPGACAESPCRLAAPQCGCPSDRTCQWSSSEGTHCAPIGAAGVAEPCNDELECGRGLTCIWWPDRAGGGACTLWCDEDADCSLGAICAQVSVVTTAGVCTASCDPLTSAECAGELVCHLLRRRRFEDGVTKDVDVCRRAGTAAQGESCSSPADCVGGATCVGSACAAYCPVGDPTSCPAGLTCASTPSWTLRGVTYGTCR